MKFNLKFITYLSIAFLAGVIFSTVLFSTTNLGNALRVIKKDNDLSSVNGLMFEIIQGEKNCHNGLGVIINGVCKKNVEILVDGNQKYILGDIENYFNSLKIKKDLDLYDISLNNFINDETNEDEIMAAADVGCVTLADATAGNVETTTHDITACRDIRVTDGIGMPIIK